MENRGTYIDGCHATIFILGTGALTSCPGWIQQCMNTFLERYRRCRCGLANSYVALVSDPEHPVLSGHQVQVGVWCPVRQSVVRTPLRARRRWGREREKVPRIQQPPPVDVHYDYSLLEEVVASLDAGGQCDAESEQTSPHHSNDRAWDVMASQLHHLLDSLPWSPGEYAIVDVHWLLGEDPIPSPSTAVSLSGALLRLRMWHQMHLQIVTTTSSSSTTDQDISVQYEEWFDVVEAQVCGTDNWTDGLADIWRGNMHFTEHRSTMKQACRQTVVFHGFSLALRTDTTSPLPDDVTTTDNDVITSPSTLLRDVGLPECATPTHMEVVQILDTSTLPLFWLSPLHCTLSLDSTRHTDSKLLLRELFTGSTGVLARLCFSEESKPTLQHKTTSDWNKHIQSVNETDFCSNSSHSPLAAYEAGPLLVVFSLDQSNSEQLSCDTWFLWKPEAINTAPFLCLQKIQPEATCNGGQLSLTVPVVAITEDQEAALDGQFTLSDLSSSDLVDDLHKRVACLKHELDMSPSEWPEIKALTTYEWIQRKLVRRLTTPDLMFGQMIAPPPSSSATKTCVSAEDVLKCFHDTGSPATSELSPIANDMSDILKVHDPGVSGDSVPTFENIAAGTPGRRYHGVNYCLQPEDSVVDSRLTRIQQRYLLSERTSNCSSSNTPEVKLEQRRRRRMKRSEVNARRDEGKGRGGGDGEGGEGVTVERLELTARRERKEEEEGGEGGSEMRNRVGVTGDCDDGGMDEGLLVDSTPADPATCSGSGAGVKLSSSPVMKLNRSPVVKLHRVQTPPSVSLLNKLTKQRNNATENKEGQCSQSHDEHASPILEKHRLELTVCGVRDQTSFVQLEPSVSPRSAGSKLRRSPRKRLELTLNDASRTSSVDAEFQTSSGGDDGTKLRRSPRKNKWISGKTSGSRPPADDKQASNKGKSSKKKLEQIIVVSLKKKGMQRDHVCFRKCYNRLFNLSKSFLKDLRSSKTLVSEMHRVVDLNVSQVVDFELRQAHSTL